MTRLGHHDFRSVARIIVRTIVAMATDRHGAPMCACRRYIAKFSTP